MQNTSDMIADHRERPASDPGRHHKIELTAYYRYLDRGCEDGHDIEDWLQAESQLAEENV